MERKRKKIDKSGFPIMTNIGQQFLNNVMKEESSARNNSLHKHCYQLLKIMDKEKIQKQIDRNRDLIEKALEMNDTEMMYYIVRRLAKDNERLIAKLKE